MVVGVAILRNAKIPPPVPTMRTHHAPPRGNTIDGYCGGEVRMRIWVRGRL